MTKLRKQNYGLNRRSVLNNKAKLNTHTPPLQKQNYHLLKSTSQTTGPISLKKRAKSGSKRLVGDREEAQCIHVLSKASLIIEETVNSGASNFDGDFLIKVEPTYIRSEVKFRNTEGFTISKSHWEAIMKKTLLHGGVPALITVNKNKKQLITMELCDFAEILQNIQGK